MVGIKDRPVTIAMSGFKVGLSKICQLNCTWSGRNKYATKCIKDHTDNIQSYQ